MFPEVVYQLSAVACEVMNVIIMSSSVSDKSDNLSELETCCVAAENDLGSCVFEI